MKYFVSTLNFSSIQREKISTVLPRMVNSDIKNVEISSFHPYEKNLDEILLDYVEKNNLNILLHNFSPPSEDNFFLNLSDENKTKREKTKDFIKERIKLTKKLGSDYYSFHAGFRVDYVIGIHEYESRISDELAISLFIKELKEIVNFAEKEKIHIGVENHVAILENKDNMILYGLENWKKIFKEIETEYLHLHLDLGHLKITSKEHSFDYNKFLELFGDKVIGMHVHDNTDTKVDSHEPFKGKYWFGKEQFKHLKNLKYIILETKTNGNTKLIKQMIDYLESERKK